MLNYLNYYVIIRGNFSKIIKMKVVIQRVQNASVKIDGNIVGKINKGLLVFFAVHALDNPDKIVKMTEKVSNLRIFEDNENKMNLSVKDISGEILVISQFTLYGDTKKGNRPSFIESANPEIAVPIYNKFVDELKKSGLKIKTGEFGAMMQIELVNDGPVTIIHEI